MGYKWDRETIRGYIKKRVAKQKSLRASDVRTDSPTLYYAAKYYYGSYKAALAEVMGTPPSHKNSELQSLDKESLLKELVRLFAEGVDLSYTAVRHLPIFRQAVKFYGSWRVAVESAGIAYIEVKRYGWGAARILLQNRDKPVDNVDITS